MKRIVANNITYGPYETATEYLGHFEADGALLPKTVVGQGFVDEWIGDIPVQSQPPAPVPVPQSVPMVKARLVLLQAGKLDLINDQVALASDAVKIKWEYTTDIHRYDPDVIDIATSAGMGADDLDALFIATTKL